MTTAFNKGSCFNCGEEVSLSDYDEIGHCRVWVCNPEDYKRYDREFKLRRKQQREESR